MCATTLDWLTFFQRFKIKPVCSVLVFPLFKYISLMRLGGVEVVSKNSGSLLAAELYASTAVYFVCMCQATRAPVSLLPNEGEVAVLFP